MNEKVLENNRVKIIGKVVSGFVFSHKVAGENFYTADVVVRRLSGFEDIIPLVISDRVVDTNRNFVGQIVSITGQFRSYNKRDEDKTRLILSVFVMEWNVLEESTECDGFNEIFLDGYICKDPVHRNTPMGRDITDIFLAVNRPYGKSDYIPCICWGRNANYASGLGKGTHIRLYGRIQSRAYKKIIDDTRGEIRIAYEVSISRIEELKGE